MRSTLTALLCLTLCSFTARAQQEQEASPALPAATAPVEHSAAEPLVAPIADITPEPAVEPVVAPTAESAAEPVAEPEAPVPAVMPVGDAERGRLVFGPCRTCHYPQAAMGHNNGPNLHRIFGKVAGKQPGFDYYSQTFKDAEFVWTPRLMYAWLESPMTMFPESTMMSLGVPDPQQRADLIAYLEQASVRDP